MTLFGLAFRSHRTSLILMSILSALTGVLNAGAFETLVGNTPAERAAFGYQMELLGKQLTYLLPDPVQLDTMGGYLTWRAFGALSLIFAIWAILASTGAGRGDEERGLTEHWLGVTLVFFGVGLAVAQLVLTRRAAGSIGAIVVVALYELNAAARSGLDLGGLGSISPFALVDRSRPLLPVGGGVDVAATTALYVTAAALTALCVAAFLRRDVGGVLVRLGTERTRAASRPSSDPMLRIPVLAIVDQQRWWLIGWTIAFAILAYFLTTLARSIVDGMMAIPSLRVYFDRLGIAAYSDFIGVLWFGTALFILSGLVIAQANGWAADDGEGRLEAVLAAGASRSRVVLERVAALLLIVAVVATVSSVIVFYGMRALDIPVPGDRLAIATLDQLPVVFAFAGIGAALVGWRPRTAVVVLGAVAVISYFVQQFYAIFDWPDWVGRLSIYQLYGMPLSRNDWVGIVTLVAIGVAGTAIALVSMRRRDVGT